ncbi:MAG TPA: hypothetical protein PKW66_12505, partial [Polyangiaceae bacterium]|nr:hypothetical protein [Polyangiaceae bacterium]
QGYNSSMTRLVAISVAFLGVVSTACGSSDSTTDYASSPGSDVGVDAAQEALPDGADEALPPDGGAVDAPQDLEPVLEGSTDTGADVLPDGQADVQEASVSDGPEPDANPSWPTCDAQPPGVADQTLPEIWSANPDSPTEVWITGLYVTAISRGKCSAGAACQVFLQDALTYASFQGGAHHAMKLFVSGNTAKHFESLAVGDRVNVLAHAWRYNVNPSQRELLLQVNSSLRGCAKKVGSGEPTPIEGVALTDLTVEAYENTHGPLLVKVDGVSGKPGVPSETFALWKTGGPFVDAGLETVVSLSPYFLPGGVFSGLPTNATTVVSFSSIVGVFGLFVPSSDGGSAKYLMLYPRTMDDVSLL